ncbi:MAG: ABC transporter substrate-binding protein [Gammaproteobacteria bacterium]|nr:ABC transporter substrate-binding protein [Gammaproteobacteria bacterium]
MSHDQRGSAFGRRQFIKASSALAGASALGLAPLAARAQTPKRGGELRFATRTDGARLDTHRQFVYWTSNALAATTYGLLDIDQQLNVKPGVAESWEANKTLDVYTFKIRRGMEYHNGRSIDAESVKWNFERIMDPKIGAAFTRSATVEIKEIKVLDKETVQFVLKGPSAVFPSNMVYYPCNLMAPDSENPDTNPIGCGPFKYKSWKRFDTTVMERFENWWETDAQGNQLPYIDTLVGLPRKEDAVRLTTLRAGESQLIDNMAFTDAAEFPEKYGEEFNYWDVPHIGTAWIGFNMKNGVFSYDNPDALLVRQAAAHAIDHQAIHEAVFNERGAIAKGFYSEKSPWYSAEASSWPEYDPDKSRALLKKAKAEGARIQVVSRQAYAYMQQTGELVHAMLSEVGFNASYEVQPNAMLIQRYKKNDHSVDSTASSYRLDPDSWFTRIVHSNGSENKLRIGYKNPEADKLIDQARAEPEQARRLELYTEVENIVNRDVPFIYSHYVSMLEAGVKTLKGYQPSFAGPFSYQGGGIRTAWFDT